MVWVGVNLPPTAYMLCLAATHATLLLARLNFCASAAMNSLVYTYGCKASAVLAEPWCEVQSESQLSCKLEWIRFSCMDGLCMHWLLY